MPDPEPTKGSEVSSEKPRPKRSLFCRFLRIGVLGALALGISFLLSGLALAWRPMGKMATGDRLTRMESSPQWKDGKFVDILPRVEPNPIKIIPKWFQESAPFRRPKKGFSHPQASGKLYESAPESGTRITWLGHSTLLVEIAGKRLLIDPVWGDYVAPLELKNAKRFTPPPLPFNELPPIDAVVISHDHYDHLDYKTVLLLAESDVPFFVPLGIGSHLEYWGIDESRIFEHEWWDETKLGELTIACTPARHFSGRSFVDKDMTLWASWAFVGPEDRLFYSGDTALFPGFRDIGERYGPFTATMMENGAYNQLWADVHMGPEQAVIAHELLGGGLLIPVHWGMFDLGLHTWTEPMERILLAAQAKNIQVATLRPGQSVEPRKPPPAKRWWPKHPFKTVEEHPAFSSGVRELLDR